MSFSKMISGLQKSTKITIIACASFLAVTALVLLFLMLFPIEKKQTPALQVNQPQQTAVPQATQEAPETQPFEDEGRYTEGPHTLSTWSASIEGHSRSTNEYFEYIRSTYEPQETMWHQYITEPTEKVTQWTEPEETVVSETGTWDESGTTAPWETEDSGMESSDYIHTGSETVTETIILPPEPSEDVPVQSEPLPTDPPPTEPPVTDPPPTDPPVVDVPAPTDEFIAG